MATDGMVTSSTLWHRLSPLHIHTLYHVSAALVAALCFTYSSKTRKVIYSIDLIRL